MSHIDKKISGGLLEQTKNDRKSSQDKEMEEVDDKLIGDDLQIKKAGELNDKKPARENNY